MKKFALKILRGLPKKQYWELFELEQKPSLNVISALMMIRSNPVTKDEKTVSPIIWEDGCLEEVCGSCAMLINGVPRQACTALIDEIINETNNTTITLAPLTKFPLIRDLMVDRQVMFENLKKCHTWIDTDGSYDHGSGPKIIPDVQEVMYPLSTCMTCGCCSEACPQINDKTSFVGPATISQVRLFNMHPTGKTQRAKRLKTLMSEGGIGECGNAQNCVRVCPKKIPLTDSIAKIGRDASLQIFKNIFSPDFSQNLTKS